MGFARPPCSPAAADPAACYGHRHWNILAVRAPRADVARAIVVTRVRRMWRGRRRAPAHYSCFRRDENRHGPSGSSLGACAKAKPAPRHSRRRFLRARLPAIRPTEIPAVQYPDIQRRSWAGCRPPTAPVLRRKPEFRHVPTAPPDQERHRAAS